MTDAPDRRDVALELTKIAGVQGNRGPQFELDLIPPWSKYPIKAWIDQGGFPDAPTPGTYRCILERGALKEGKDGSKDYDYRWGLVQFNVKGEGPPAAPQATAAPAAAVATRPASVPKYEDQEAIRNRSIQRQVALKAAVDFHATPSAEGEATAPDVVRTAGIFYQWLSAPQDATLAPPQSTERPSDAQEGSPDPSGFDDLPSGSNYAGAGLLPRFDSPGGLLNWATSTHGKLAGEVYKALGVENIMGLEAMGTQKAHEKLVKEWG